VQVLHRISGFSSTKITRLETFPTLAGFHRKVTAEFLDCEFPVFGGCAGLD